VKLAVSEAHNQSNSEIFEITNAQRRQPLHDLSEVTANITIMASTTQSVQCFGKKKTATAVAHCKVRKFCAVLV
jgi:uncharacterized protein YkwD